MAWVTYRASRAGVALDRHHRVKVIVSDGTRSAAALTTFTTPGGRSAILVGWLVAAAIAALWSSPGSSGAAARC
jgi:hypothetical protein